MASTPWVTPAQLRHRLPAVSREQWLELLQHLSRSGASRFGLLNAPAAHAFALRRGWLPKALPPATAPPADDAPGPGPLLLNPSPAAPPQQRLSWIPEHQFWQLLPAKLPLEQRTALLVALAQAGHLRDGSVRIPPGLALAKRHGLLSPPPAAPAAPPAPPPGNRSLEQLLEILDADHDAPISDAEHRILERHYILRRIARHQHGARL